jgi:hypothetical protein
LSALESCALQVNVVKQCQDDLDAETRQSAQRADDAVPVLRTNPDMLRLFVDNGKIAATLAARCRSKNSTRSTW